MDNSDKTPRTPKSIFYTYGIGEIVLVIKAQMLGLFTLYLCVTVMGLSTTAVGFIAALSLLWDAPLDPYIGYVSDRSRSRLGRRHAFMLLGTLTMGISLWACFAPPRGFGPAGLLWFLSVLWFMPFSMIADIPDLDTRITGDGREGSCFGLLLFGQRIATSIALLLTGVLAGRFAGLVSGQAEQDAATARRIGLLYGVLPAVCILFSIVFIFRYDVNEHKIETVRADLDR